MELNKVKKSIEQSFTTLQKIKNLTPSKDNSSKNSQNFSSQFGTQSYSQ